jgi:hypothetical protein
VSNPGFLGAQDQRLIEVEAALAQHGTVTKAAKALGLSRSTFTHRLNTLQRYRDAPEGQRGAIDAAALDASTASHGWIKTDGDGNIIGHSTFWKAQAQSLEDVTEALREGLEAIAPGQYAAIPLERPDPLGALLVMDFADVHIGKLCVSTETGYEYSRDVAVTRMLQGTKALLRKASGHGIARVLVVLGNDILHIDTAKRQTTSGTPQDTDGSIHQMYQDAQRAYVAVIEACAADYHVDLIYCPSNHDWLMGWALANSIGIWFSQHPNVTVSPYNLSEEHRKYYRFGGNLIGLTHGDGAREADLYPLMMTEARSHVSACAHRYWYLHHYHHKIRKAQGVRPHDREKDHIGLTVVKSGVTTQEGDNVQIEYVRSPSPPDGWHNRNGYVNRQAVECFIHDPHDGQNARFTEWF